MIKNNHFEVGQQLFLLLLMQLQRVFNQLRTTNNRFIAITAVSTVLLSTFLASSKRPMSTKLFNPPQQAPLWDHTPELISIQTEKLIKESKDLDDRISQIALGDVTIENVINPIADLENKQSGLSNQLSFYQHVSSSKDLRDASNASDAKFRKYSIEAGLREDVFKVIDAVYNKYAEDNSIGKETKRFIEKIHNQYKRNGLSLPSEKREDVKNLKQELSELALKYSSNLSEETESILFSKEQLQGVPDDVIENFEVVEKDNESLYKMTFKYPDIFPVMKYAKLEATRKEALIGDQNKVAENADILIKAVKLRGKLAKLLGYNNFSEYILEERMAKTPKTVNKFLEDLKVKLKPLGEAEIKLLKEMKKKETGDDTYYLWDQRYYNTKMLEEQYNVDELKIAEYFPIKNTIEKMLSIYETIFKLKFIEIPSDAQEYNTWHEDVKQFQVWKMDNTEKPEFVGHLYFDLHPRQGKYGHAANFGLKAGYTDIETGERSYPVTSLVCNFTKDTKDKPSLLKHGEVVTFFHELGHGIHDLMGNTRYSRFHGTSVAWDFVEMPSQLLEYFCWDKDQLKELSSHYVSKEHLSDDLISSLVASKHVNGALFNLRQLHFGLFDMALHTSEDGEVDMNLLWNKLREEICLISNGGIEFKGYGSFGHMMGGYASGYYGYLWSQVFAADVFYSKFKANPLNVTNGVAYRDQILSKGGSREESESLKEFLGREPNSEAFLKELGV